MTPIEDIDEIYADLTSGYPVREHVYWHFVRRYMEAYYEEEWLHITFGTPRRWE